jgi:hypothetical protein
MGGLGGGSGMMGLGGGMSGQMGGGGGASGGMMGPGMGRFAGSPMHKGAIRGAIAEGAIELAIREENPKSKAILKKLEEPISMSFADGTPLEDVLKYVHQASVTQSYSGIPIYVDIKALEEAGVNPQSTIIVDLDGVPLRTTLRLALKQIGLAYCVRDGVLIVSSEAGINEELEEAQLELDKRENMQGNAAAGGQ